MAGHHGSDILAGHLGLGGLLAAGRLYTAHGQLERGDRTFDISPPGLATSSRTSAETAKLVWPLRIDRIRSLVLGSGLATDSAPLVSSAVHVSRISLGGRPSGRGNNHS
jgi:hypothetical protein